MIPEFVQSPDRLWTAVHTRPRCEKQVAAYCTRFGIRHYLPLRKQVKRYQRRNVVVFLPMFHGYCFAQLNAEDRQCLHQSHKVVTVLAVDCVAEERLLAELRELYTLEQASFSAEITVHPELVAGKAVRIAAGPLCGLTGYVEKRRQTTRVSVNVELLGQSVAVELDVGEVTVEE
jgi:transcription antitermination factor NusG